MAKNFWKETKPTQFQSTTSDIPFYCLEKPSVGTLEFLFLVKEWDNMKVGLADDKIRYIEECRDALKRKIGLDRTVDPLYTVNLKIFYLSRAVLCFKLCWLHNSRQGTTCRHSTCECNVRCRNMIQQETLGSIGLSTTR